MKKNDREEEREYEEPSLEDFLMDEEEDKEYIEIKKKRNALVKRVIAIGISIFLVANVLGIWLNLFSLDAIQFIRKSNELSKIEEVSQLKESVVTIQGERSRGTGFSISAQGLIVTNHHVVDGQRQLIISYPDGQLFEGEIIESYANIDLAFVNVEGEDLPYLPLSEQEGVIDDPIYVIGNPLSHSQIVTDGYIVSDSENLQVLKISAPIYSGNSGSPVINESGEVVGVVYARTIPKILDDEDSEGLAIPIRFVTERLDRLNLRNE